LTILEEDAWRFLEKEEILLRGDKKFAFKTARGVQFKYCKKRKYVGRVKAIFSTTS